MNYRLIDFTRICFDIIASVKLWLAKNSEYYFYKMQIIAFAQFKSDCSLYYTRRNMIFHYDQLLLLKKKLFLN